MANTPPSGTMFAIPNLAIPSPTDPTQYPNNTLVPPGTEPATWACVVSGQQYSEMNGTYNTIGSHYYAGNQYQYATFFCFGRQPITNSMRGWLSRTALAGAIYDGTTGNYTGNTSTIVSGSAILGEYVTISSPYSFALSAYSLVSDVLDSWTIAGSTNGTTWTVVDSQTGANLQNKGVGVYTPNSSVSYTNYIIIITKVSNGTAAQLYTWNLYSPYVQPPCFVAGTRVLTQNGYKPIETLMMNDMMVLSDGRVVEYGMKKFVVESANEMSAPYQIEAGAFGKGKPAVDICLSPHHKIQIRKGVWISPERAAKTNNKVKQYGIGEPVTYWHIACADYLKDNLVCEGLVVECLATNKNYTGPSKVYTWSDRLGGFTRASRALKQLAM